MLCHVRFIVKLIVIIVRVVMLSLMAPNLDGSHLIAESQYEEIMSRKYQKIVKIDFKFVLG